MTQYVYITPFLNLTVYGIRSFCSVVKRFLGGAVKKTTDAAKTLAAEATRKRSVASGLHSGGKKEALPSTTGATSAKEMEKLGRLATDIKVDPR